MIKMVFSQLITHIEEGEVWESDHKIISKLNGDIKIENKHFDENLEAGIKYFLFNDLEEYTKKMTAVGFTRAWQALMFEGATIVNAKSGRILQLEKDTEEPTLLLSYQGFGNGGRFKFEDINISVEEINSQWYIH